MALDLIFKAFSPGDSWSMATGAKSGGWVAHFPISGFAQKLKMWLMGFGTVGTGLDRGVGHFGMSSFLSINVLLISICERLGPWMGAMWVWKCRLPVDKRRASVWC